MGAMLVGFEPTTSALQTYAIPAATASLQRKACKTDLKKQVPYTWHLLKVQHSNHLRFRHTMHMKNRLYSYIQTDSNNTSCTFSLIFFLTFSYHYLLSFFVSYLFSMNTMLSLMNRILYSFLNPFQCFLKHDSGTCHIDSLKACSTFTKYFSTIQP